MVSSISNTIEQLASASKKPQQLQIPIQELKKDNYLHKGENRHSKNMVEELDREQQILLKENKQNIIDFILDNKQSIKIEDLKIYESIYKCYREKGNCQVCNTITNIICISCGNYKNEVWLCTNHWKQHAIKNHI
jgi:hypothetical protein